MPPIAAPVIIVCVLWKRWLCENRFCLGKREHLHQKHNDRCFQIKTNHATQLPFVFIENTHNTPFYFYIHVAQFFFSVLGRKNSGHVDSNVTLYVCFGPERGGWRWGDGRGRKLVSVELSHIFPGRDAKTVAFTEAELGCWFRRWDVIGWRQSKLLLLNIGCHCFRASHPVWPYE